MSHDVCELLAASIAVNGSRIAISAPEQEITYSELGDWTDRIAFRLCENVAGSTRPVAIIADNRLYAVAAMIAALKAGIVFVALDPDQSKYRLRQLLEIADPSLVLCDPDARAMISTLTETPNALIESPVAETIAPIAQAQALRARDPEAACYIFFTSGSSGEPKGIVGRYKAIGHFVNWEIKELDLDRTARVSQLASPSFDAILRDIFVPLAVGGTMCIPPRGNLIADGVPFARWLDENGVTLLHTIPSILRRLVDGIEKKGTARPRSLTHVCVAGEPLLPIDVARFYRIFGASMVFLNLYGPSETTMVKLFHRVQLEDAGTSSVPIGRPMDGSRVIILDPNQGPVPPGVIGEIYIRTPYRSLGYFGRPDLTAETFIPNPLSDDASDIVYRTGDFGRMLATHEIEFAGRRDRQIKMNGVRVELAEVENILRKHSGVRDVAVTVKDDHPGESNLIAHLVLTQGTALDDLRVYMTEAAPPGMAPRYYLLSEALPRTTSGKVKYSALPTADIPAEREFPLAPQTPLEHAISEIWAELLSVPVDDIDIHFFDVGGHSLLATQVLSRVEAAFSVSVSLREFLHNPTIRGLAQQITFEIVSISGSDPELISLLREG
jgi:amino acid adenylation domain-containing protein